MATAQAAFLLALLVAPSAAQLPNTPEPQVQVDSVRTRSRPLPPPPQTDPARLQTSYGLAFSAKAICSACFVARRDVDDFIERDLKTDPVFDWWEDVEVEVDRVTRTVTLGLPNGLSRRAVYFERLGCTIIPEGADDVFFEPVDIAHQLPDSSTQDWPTGARNAHAPLPAEVDAEELEAAEAFAFADSARDIPQRTRALLVVYGGRIIAERYAAGFDSSSLQIGWSMGKSIMSALIGVLVAEGRLRIEDPAPIAAWREAGDPRGAITIADLLHMSSGLLFARTRPEKKTQLNDHFLVYYGAIDVRALSIGKPLLHAPNTRWSYRNGDVLSLGAIVRAQAEAADGSYLAFPQRKLFDRIGVRNLILETDPFGNFVMTGYDWGTARDWARFGLLHLWDGVWQGQRIFTEDWVDFVRTPAPADTTRGYGGLFWLNRGGAYTDIPEDAFWAAGHLGNVTMIIPSLDLVIVRLGHATDAVAFRPYLNELIGRIVSAVELPEGD